MDQTTYNDTLTDLIITHNIVEFNVVVNLFKIALYYINPAIMYYI